MKKGTFGPVGPLDRGTVLPDKLALHLRVRGPTPYVPQVVPVTPAVVCIL